MSTYNNTPYSTKTLEGDLLPKSSVYSIDLNLEVKDITKYIPRFYGELYLKNFNQIYPVKTQYNAANIKIESFENDKTAPYPIKYELLYRSNGRYIIVDSIDTDNGRADFKNLIKDYTYYVKAIDISNKYQSKVQKFIPTEYDLEQQPIIISPYKNLSYDKFQYNFIVNNIFGEKTVYLENNKPHIKLEKIDDKRYKVYLSEIKNRADEFDIVLEDYRENEIVKIIEHIYINDGYSEAYDFSIEFLDNGSAIFKWRADGTIDYFNVYLDKNKISEPIIGTGLKTYIANNYELNKTQYFKIGTKRNEKEKFSEIIEISSIDEKLDNVEALFNFKYGEVITDKSLYKKTVTIQGNPTLQSDNSLYFDGTDDRISVSINPLLTDDFTYEIYYKPTNDTSRINQRLIQVGKNQATIGTFCLCKDEYSQRLALWIVESNNNWVKLGASTFEMTPFTLFHICLQRKNGIFYVYANGNNILTIDSKPTFSITDNILYVGLTDSNGTNDALIGYVYSVRLTKGLRYNDSFNIPEYKFPIKHKISKPTKLEYSIKDNNDLHIDIIHESNNVDNYSVYLEENEITSIDGLTPIVTSTSKNIVIPNFDVYNNYDKTLKLVASTNKYNHSYLSENKDLYAAYDWTPENFSFMLDATNATFDANKNIEKLYDNINNIEFNQTNNTNKPKLKYDISINSNVISFDGIDDYMLSPTANSISSNVGVLWSLVIFKKANSNIGTSCVFRYMVGIESSNAGRYAIYTSTGSINNLGLGSRRLDNDSILSHYQTEDPGTNWNIGLYYRDYINGLSRIRSNSKIFDSTTTDKGATQNTTQTAKLACLGSERAESGFFNGDIALIINGNNNLNEDEQLKLEGWAAHKYGLTDNLPSDHPYKDRRPIIDHTPINFTAEFKND